MDALEARASELARTERRDPIDLKVRHFDAVQQVAVRAEVAGPFGFFLAKVI